MTKSFAYLRVSGKGQVDGDGFDRQLAACRSFAQVQSLDIVEIFREEGVSGTKELDDRPALSELFAALDENGVKTVIVEKLDRLARDLMVQESIIRDFMKHGYQLLSTCEPDLCSDEPTRKFIRQVMGALAEYDKTMVVQKLRAARQRKKAREGKGEGRKAFGEKPGEAETLTAIRDFHSRGMTSFEISSMLNTAIHMFPTRSGKLWHRCTVAKILSRHQTA